MGTRRWRLMRYISMFRALALRDWALEMRPGL